ncbi:MAG: colicin D domain-containing protein [Rickettsiaceae bacterium]
MFLCVSTSKTAAGLPDPDDKDKQGQCDQGVSLVKRQLQSKYKHAEDFGVFGNYNKVRAQEFFDAIKDFVTSDSVYKKEIIYRGEERCIYIDKNTDRGALTKDGQFESGWQLDPKQLNDILTKGRLS